jgi:hypothetical protein
VAGIALSVFGTLAFGIYFPATSSLTDRAQTAQIDQGTMPTQRPAKAAVATR